MDISTIIACGVILSAAAIIQSSVGFAYALFATPLLVWLGIPLHHVIVIVATGSMIQSATGVRYLRASVPWKQSLTATILRIAWLLVGLLILKQLITLDSRYILFTVGCAVCLLVLVRHFWKPHPVEKVHWAWTAFAFSTSGILAGTVGMAGPPLVLWVTAHKWPPAKIRGFYFATYLTFIPVLIVIMSIFPGFGPVWKSALTGVVFAPFIYGGSQIGLRIGQRLSKKWLYKLTFIFLLATGVGAMVSAL